MKIIKALTIILFTSIFSTAASTEENTMNQYKATFAGGCFWCMQPPFDKLEGVIKTTVGYTAGHTQNPKYEQVSAGGTGHSEAIEIVYDPSKVSYEELLKVFWVNIDPTTKDRQFCDVGNQYRSEIYYHDETQRDLAIKSKEDILKSDKIKKVETPISEASVFYPAEEHHQDYYKKNPVRYKFYRYNCGRDKRLNYLWGKDK